MSRRLLAIGLCGAVSAWVPTSFAQVPPTCPVMNGASPELAARDANARLRFIQSRLAAEAPRMRTWTWGWGVGFGALTAGAGGLAGILYATGNPDMGLDEVIAGSAALVGVGFVLVTLQPVMGDQRTLDVRLVDPVLASNPCAVLAEAEQFFLRDAEAERIGRAWYSHALGVVFNLGVGAVLGFGLGHWGSAALTTGVGLVLAELREWTQPDALIGDLARYRTGVFDNAPRASASLTWSVAPSVDARGLGIAVYGTF